MKQKVTEITKETPSHASAEEDLRRSEAMLRTTQRLAQVGGWQLDLRDLQDLNRNKLYWTDETFRIFGYEPGEVEITNDLFFQLVHPDDREAIARAVAAALAGNKSYEITHRIICRDGDERIIHEWADVITNEKGQPVQLIGACQDITERKQAEEALHQAKTYAESIVATVPQPLIVLDAALSVITANESFYETFQVNPQETEKKYIYDLGNGQWNIPDLRRLLEEILPDNSRFDDYEVRHRFEHIGNKIMLLNARRIEALAQNPFILLSIEDITEWKKAEEALYETKERLRLMVESVNDYAIFSLDTAGRVITWNSGAEKIFGFSADSITGQPAALLFTPEDQERKVPEHEMLTAREKGRAEDERWHVRRSGERFFASGIMASIRDDSGHLLGFVKIARDVTRQKEAEKALIEARIRADEANRAKSEFLANMSHEIRTPMNAVVGLSSILAMNKDLTPKQQEMVNTLQLSAQSLMSLIDDLLDIAKIETNKIDMEHIPFMLEDVMNEVCGVLSTRAEEKGITLDCICSLEEQSFLGDPLRIRQIVMNLVSNAIKFTETGGVTVTLFSTPHEKADQAHVRIIVSDTGVGIPRDKLESIFEKFIQADTSTTRKFGGTGLGLAISKNLAEIMGGRITVTSSLGKGSEFTLHLPLPYANTRSSIKPKLKVDDTRRMVTSSQRLCVLLVEDYKPNVLVARSLLENLGYDIAIASNGKEALAKIRSSRDRYAAVLMDIQMPDMDGFEATYFIRQEEQAKGLPRLPIIAITAHALQGDKERCLDAGMDDYISKPFQLAELEKALRKIRQQNVLAAVDAA